MISLCFHDKHCNFTSKLSFRSHLEASPRHLFEKKAECESWAIEIVLLNWQSHFPVSSLCKTVFLGKPLETAVLSFPVVVRYRPLYCRSWLCMCLCHGELSGGSGQWHFCKGRASPLNAGGKTLQSIIFLLCLDFVLSGLWSGFIGKRSVGSRLCCLFCFSAN